MVTCFPWALTIAKTHRNEMCRVWWEPTTLPPVLAPATNTHPHYQKANKATKSTHHSYMILQNILRPFVRFATPNLCSKCNSDNNNKNSSVWIDAVTQLLHCLFICSRSCLWWETSVRDTPIMLLQTNYRNVGGTVHYSYKVHIYSIFVWVCCARQITAHLDGMTMFRFFYWQ